VKEKDQRRVIHFGRSSVFSREACMKELRLLCILAHPDDESLAAGGILARYAAEGVATYLITATRGERGWRGDPDSYPGAAAVGTIRQAELQAAARLLGLHEVTFLRYQDGELDQADTIDGICQLVKQLRRIRPQVVVTFDPTGYYGHPDHVAISQWTTAAVMAAADPTFAAYTAWPPHRTSKLYYLAATGEAQAAFQSVFGDLVMPIDGIERRATAWPEWAITTRVDTAAYGSQVWQAVQCHRSQLRGLQALANRPPAYQPELWGTQTFYRAFSLVNGGRSLENDLFAGLQHHTATRRLPWPPPTELELMGAARRNE
jgi:LmbE family N-acetylglucosaminyl deacetylase